MPASADSGKGLLGLSHQSLQGLCHGKAKFSMRLWLIMDAVYGADLDHLARIQKADAAGSGEIAVKRRKPPASYRSPIEFASNRPNLDHGRRADQQYLKAAVTGLHVKGKGHIDQPGHARKDRLWRRGKASLHVIGAQHDGQGIQRAVALQGDLKPDSAIHVVAHHRVIEGCGSPGQPFLGQFPGAAQGPPANLGPSNIRPKATVFATLQNRGGPMRVAVSEGHQNGHGNLFGTLRETSLKKDCGKSPRPLGLSLGRAHIEANHQPMREQMFNLNESAAAPKGGLIKDGSEATFMQDVIEASRDVPVIVDFWAPWCGPCKTLGPALEAAVTEAKGKVRMVKVNVDENQMIAGQLRIQSIPTVYAFWQGQPVDGFQGALPGSEIKKFLERIIALGGDGGLAEAIEAAEAMLAEGAAVDAADTFAAILGEEPENAAAYSGLVRSHLAMGNLEQAEAFAANAPAAIAGSKELDAAKAQINLAKQAAKAGPVADLEAAVAADPANHQARFDLAAALLASDRTEEAVDQLLELFRRDREWNEGAAKTQLFTIFDALNAKDPIVLKGRRKLSSMIFA